MQERFFEQGAFDAFCEGFTEELNKRSKEILEPLLRGFSDEAWKAELRQIEERRAELEATIVAGESDPPKPVLHPHMAQVFREKAEALVAALAHDMQHDSARLALRGLRREDRDPSR